MSEEPRVPPGELAQPPAPQLAMEWPREYHHRAPRELTSVDLDPDSSRPALRRRRSNSDPATAVLGKLPPLGVGYAFCTMRYLGTHLLGRRFERYA
jgi:hypothetical protein